jgi:hypothetical protein
MMGFLVVSLLEDWSLYSFNLKWRKSGYHLTVSSFVILSHLLAALTQLVLLSGSWLAAPSKPTADR